MRGSPARARSFRRRRSFACATSERGPSPHVAADSAALRGGDVRGEEPRSCGLFAAAATISQRVCRAADGLAPRPSGDAVTYVVNRNINYTNICAYHCGFCAFSKGAAPSSLRGARLRPAISRRSRAGSSEACGARRDRGVPARRHPPGFTGDTYLLDRRGGEARPCRRCTCTRFHRSRSRHGAQTLGLPLARLSRAPRGSRARHPAGHGRRDSRRRGARHHLPRQAHDRAMARGDATPRIGSGCSTTATIMFGHVDGLDIGRAICCACAAAAAHGRHHRVRAAALRAHGGAVYLQAVARARVRPCARRC